MKSGQAVECCRQVLWVSCWSTDWQLPSIRHEIMKYYKRGTAACLRIKIVNPHICRCACGPRPRARWVVKLRYIEISIRYRYIARGNIEIFDIPVSTFWHTCLIFTCGVKKSWNFYWNFHWNFHYQWKFQWKCHEIRQDDISKSRCRYIENFDISAGDKIRYDISISNRYFDIFDTSKHH